mmetsp:Transcript_15292/g.38631  ORF Transcript_15292/g.38631 Transcript_15292/m.38631 type:complete len:227 (+) Transcript_15292:812-1492(+)
MRVYAHHFLPNCAQPALPTYFTLSSFLPSAKLVHYLAGKSSSSALTSLPAPHLLYVDFSVVFRHAREAEVGYLQVGIGVVGREKNVLRLQISVHHTLCMHERHTRNELFGQSCRILLTEGSIRHNAIKQLSTCYQLEYNMYVLVYKWRPARTTVSFFQLHLLFSLYFCQFFLSILHLFQFILFSLPSLPSSPLHFAYLHTLRRKYDILYLHDMFVLLKSDQRLYFV